MFAANPRRSSVRMNQRGISSTLKLPLALTINFRSTFHLDFNAFSKTVMVSHGCFLSESFLYQPVVARPHSRKDAISL